MKSRKGFTLIEIVVSLALLTMSFSVLAYSLSAGYSQYNRSNQYKKSSDKDLAEIQKATIADDSNTSVDSQYTMEAKGKSVKVDLYTYKDPSSSSAPSLSRFEAKDSEFNSNAVKFEYYSVDAKTSQTSKINELEGRRILNFDDLPGIQYSALNKSNEDWGKWSYIGWSTQIHNYEGVYAGEPEEASSTNGYKGLITESNFKQVLQYYKNQKIPQKLYATYVYSKDVSGNQNEMYLLAAATQKTRFQRDQDNVRLLASKAAELIKENGLSIITSNFGSNSPVTSTGIEVLHFRENGWPVLANTVYYQWKEPNAYYSTFEESDKKPYKFFPKIGNDKIYTGGVGSSGFLYRVFNEGIGFDLSQTGNSTTNTDFYHNINYDYNNLFFGDAFLTDSYKGFLGFWHNKTSQHLYSLFMKVDTTNKIVRVWAGQVTSSSSTEALRGYDYTASYA